MKDSDPIITIDQALSQLPGPGGERFAAMFKRHDVEVEFYAPRGHDPQTPHTRDEAYFVARGSGQFRMEDKTQAFGPGDFLFVRAGVEHRFEDFTDDLAVWVVFFGPEAKKA